MSTRIRIGYLPLTDAALLIVADRAGLAEARGLTLELVRETSWANIRDKLMLGIFDAAHMLAPAAIASHLGLMHISARLVTPLMLGLNGNALTVSTALFDELAGHADGDISRPDISASALARVVADRVARGLKPLVFGHVFPYSTHHYQLRFWIKSAGLVPGEDVLLAVLPPPTMVTALAGGHIDGFCVGAPWNSIAVAQADARILHLGCDLVADAPEKVLAIREVWQQENADAATALVKAVRAAAAYLPDHVDEVSVWLSEQMEGASPAMIASILTGHLDLGGGRRRVEPKYLMLGEAVLEPDPQQALWLYNEMVEARQTRFNIDDADAAEELFS